MYNDLEKVEINFPDISFEKRWGGLGGYRATVPNVYVVNSKRDFDECAHKLNTCVSNMGLRERPALLVNLLEVTGINKDSCATKVIDKIRRANIKRHSLNPESDISPIKGVVYYPVYESDPFHKHGDPEFMDMDPVSTRHKFDMEGEIPDFVTAIASAVFGVEVLQPDIAPEDEVITFDVNYGDQHSHYIDAEILADRLKL